MPSKRATRKAWSGKREECKCDLLWAAAIKKRDGYRCRRCGEDNARLLQSAHIHSRSRKSTRHDLRNGVCLCSGCHQFWAHKHPIEFAEWIRDQVLSPEDYASLLLASNKPRLWNPQAADEVKAQLAAFLADSTQADQ